jgi:hypothetical protein
MRYKLSKSFKRKELRLGKKHGTVVVVHDEGEVFPVEEFTCTLTDIGDLYLVTVFTDVEAVRYYPTSKDFTKAGQPSSEIDLSNIEDEIPVIAGFREEIWVASRNRYVTAEEMSDYNDKLWLIKDIDGEYYLYKGGLV